VTHNCWGILSDPLATVEDILHTTVLSKDSRVRNGI